MTTKSGCAERVRPARASFHLRATKRPRCNGGRGAPWGSAGRTSPARAAPRAAGADATSARRGGAGAAQPKRGAAARAFGPAKLSGEHRECNTGSVRNVTPSICTSALAWPSHVTCTPPAAPQAPSPEADRGRVSRCGTAAARRARCGAPGGAASFAQSVGTTGKAALAVRRWRQPRRQLEASARRAAQRARRPHLKSASLGSLLPVRKPSMGMPCAAERTSQRRATAHAVTRLGIAAAPARRIGARALAERSRIQRSMSPALLSRHVGHGLANRRRPRKPLTWCAGQGHAIALDVLLGNAAPHRARRRRRRPSRRSGGRELASLV